MEFITKNWSKLTLAIISLIGALMMIVPLCMAPTFNMIGASQILGIVLFFLGVAALLVIKMIDFDAQKLASATVLTLTGVFALTFLFVGAFGFKSDMAKAEGAMGNSYAIYKTMVSEGEEGLEIAKGQLAEVKIGLAGTNAALVNFPTDAGLLGQKAFLEASIAQLEAGIAAAPKQIDTGKTAHTAILFTYISMILAFGLMPLVAGCGKLVCVFLGKEENN